MLKLLEGSEVEVPIGANSKKCHGSYDDSRYKGYSFYLRRSVSGLENIIRERLNNRHPSVFMQI